MIYGLTVFVGAFLLFSIQPMIGKLLLPWFGGAPAVWSTCLAFFQLALLAGYFYAYGLVGRCRTARQGLIHLALLATGGLVLLVQARVWGTPLLPGAGWRPSGEGPPARLLLQLLAVSVGLPFLLLASTSSLVQSWFAGRHPDRSPYPLFALSNAGSLLGLLSYPLLIERAWPLATQARAWSIGYGIFFVGMSLCAWLSRSAQVADSRPAGDPPRRGDRLLWFALAACPSVAMVATTNHLCQQVAAIPLLWVVPLALYLLTMILCFASPRCYPRQLWTALLLVALPLLCWIVYQPPDGLNVLLRISGICAVLFVSAMVCHGEMVRLKPDPSRLTSFYLMTAAGGAAGGLFVSLIAPLIFPDFIEFQLGYVACAAVAVLAWRHDAQSPLRQGQSWLVQLTALAVPLCVAAILPLAWMPNLSGRPYWASAGALSLVARMLVARKGKRDWTSACWVTLTVLLALALAHQLGRYHYGAALRQRNFYGVLRIVFRSTDQPQARVHDMIHGGVLHGYQFQAFPHLPTSYYGNSSGIGIGFSLQRAILQRPVRIGGIGLGVGTLAAYATNEKDVVRFYELNPDVVRLARDPRYFSYLSGCLGTVELVLGDARLSLERELASSGSQRFDMLVVDAFNGGSIPLHLLTLESVKLYQKHLATDGILAFNVANQHLQFRRVIHGLARELQLGIVEVYQKQDKTQHQLEQTTHWILLTNSAKFLELQTRVKIAPDAVLWTDQRSNLFEILKR